MSDLLKIYIDSNRYLLLTPLQYKAFCLLPKCYREDVDYCHFRNDGISDNLWKVVGCPPIVNYSQSLFLFLLRCIRV